MMAREIQSDLSVDVFLALREHFFDTDGVPKSYQLRDKRKTQDDPLDEYICTVLQKTLPPDVRVKASGSLITPDLVVYRPGICTLTSRTDLRASPERILGVEVKKVERTASGVVARASGLDYNTTPPCGTVRVYDVDDEAVDIKGCYLFVCQEPVEDAPQTYRMTALVLCDGDLLNEDFDYYTSIVGRRTKEIGLGTYGDGANRVRPMLIFSNPLGVPFLDRQATLIHARAGLENENPALRRIGVVERSTRSEADSETVAPPSPKGQTSVGESRAFHCYRERLDVPASADAFHERDPFPVPRRSRKTAARGRFVIDFRPAR